MPDSKGTQPSSAAREREIFLAALEISDEEGRAIFLKQSCGDDSLLLKRIQGLFRERTRAGDFLQTPAATMKMDVRESGLTVNITEGPGDKIGNYKLIEKVGEGGCGIVYLAEQEEPVRRKVALKVIKLGMDTRNVITRFEAERQALAMMDHPNIAKVLDAGSTETGRPYFVMEMVQGVRITDYCDQAELSLPQRLHLFMRVCLATQHAHQKGVIHRDLKPSNILVTKHDGEPVPKVIDFGIAKAIPSMLTLTEKTLFTEHHVFMGTPAYMSPEQAQWGGLDIDTRTDIYSLGVLLYELLTGRTPFDAETLSRVGLDECRRMIREVEPDPPSIVLAGLAEQELTAISQHRGLQDRELIHAMSGDLDWIVLKCLEKDRARRYETVHDLAADLLRYLEGEPVLARPPSKVYRLQKMLRKHRGAFATAAVIMLALFLGAGVSVWQAVRATHAEKAAREASRQESILRQRAELESERAERERASARLNEYVADINLAQQALEDGNYGRSALLLNKHRPARDEADLRGFEWRYLWQVSQGDEHVMFPNQEDNVQAVAYSQDGQLLAIGQRDSIKLWHVPTQTLRATLNHGADSLAFFPDGQTLVSASWRTVRLWDLRNDGSEPRVIPGISGPVALSPDASLLAASSRGGVRILETGNWKRVRQLFGASGPFAFSPGGQHLATDSQEGIKVWSLQDPDSQVLLEDSTNVFFRFGPWIRNGGSMVFSSDGGQIIAGRNQVSPRGVFVLSIWDARTGQEIAVLPEDPGHVEHTGLISGLALSPDGRTLATASMDYSIRLWDLAGRKMIDALHAHINEVWSVAFSPGGEWLVSGDKDGGVKLWDTRKRPQKKEAPGRLLPVAFSEDGQRLAAINRRGEFVVYHLPDQEMETRIPLAEGRRGFRPPNYSLSHDLQTLAVSFNDGVVELLDLATGQSKPVEKADGRVEMLELSPDGKQLITKRHDRSLHWWDRSSDTRGVLKTRGSRVRFSPDGQTMVVLGRTNAVEVWDMTTHSLRTNLVVDVNPGFSEAFSPDGTAVAIVYFDCAIRLWSVEDGRLLGLFIGHKQPVFSVTFSPDGKTMASSSSDRTLKLWNVDTQQELLSQRLLGEPLSSLVFSPDGRMLAGGSMMSSDGGLRIFYAPPFAETDYAATPESLRQPRPEIEGFIRELSEESLDDF